MDDPGDMAIGKLIQGLGLELECGEAGARVSDITDDSRHIRPGMVFVARGQGPRTQQYLEDAVARGSAAVVVGPELKVPPRPGLGVGRAARGAAVDQALAGALAQRLMGWPSRQLKLIGVTGTNGKTTTAMIAQHLLIAAGWRCGLIGTVWVDVAGGGSRAEAKAARHADQREASSSLNLPPAATPRGPGPRPATLTTPGAIELTRLLARMVAHGCEAAVMEVSSHALDQGRTQALEFDAAIFTNLTGDHLDYHHTPQAYADAKARLFERLQATATAVVNLDDPGAARMLRDCQARIIGCRVSMECGARGAADRDQTDPEEHDPADPAPRAPRPAATARLHALRAGSSEVTLIGPWGEGRVTLPLTGRFNVSNALQASAAAWAVNPMDADALAAALARCPQVPGRVERVGAPPPAAGPPPPSPTVLVDYAHTDDALDNVLAALRPLTAGRLIVVFGCGGDRDPTKRPRMAGVAQRWADVVIVTSDNPRTEDPDRIIAQILAGSRDHANPPLTQPDRAKAIDRAVAIARPDDTVLIAGKGHEDYQIIGTTKHPFDDREHAAAALRKKKYEG